MIEQKRTRGENNIVKYCFVVSGMFNPVFSQQITYAIENFQTEESCLSLKL